MPIPFRTRLTELPEGRWLIEYSFDGEHWTRLNTYTHHQGALRGLRRLEKAYESYEAKHPNHPTVAPAFLDFRLPPPD